MPTFSVPDNDMDEDVFYDSEDEDYSENEYDSEEDESWDEDVDSEFDALPNLSHGYRRSNNFQHNGPNREWNHVNHNFEFSRSKNFPGVCAYYGKLLSGYPDRPLVQERTKSSRKNA